MENNEKYFYEVREIRSVNFEDGPVCIPKAKEGHIGASEGPGEIMSLRDRFALEAMKVILAFQSPHIPDQLDLFANAMYRIADAMMEARNGKKET